KLRTDGPPPDLPQAQGGRRRSLRLSARRHDRAPDETSSPARPGTADLGPWLPAVAALRGILETRRRPADIRIPRRQVPDHRPGRDKRRARLLRQATDLLDHARL